MTRKPSQAQPGDVWDADVITVVVFEVIKIERGVHHHDPCTLRAHTRSLHIGENYAGLVCDVYIEDERGWKLLAEVSP